jgi:tetratricopeptide (TPR) repeat protein
MKPTAISPPTSEEIRAALRDILASSAFVHSPQLGAFLRFVVDSVLAGDGDRIKSYTIAVEALGRNEDFDPKFDPIVRVEAGRVRRALTRYYSSDDVAHAVIIELPLGSYVPTFRRPMALSGAAAWASALRRRMGGAAGGWAGTAVAIALVVLAGSAVIATVGSWRSTDALMATGSVKPIESPPVEPAAGPIVPIVFVQPFDAIGASPQQVLELEALRGRLRDALARFDEIEVASDGTLPLGLPHARSAYRLAGAAEYRGDGDLALSFWLADSDEGTIVWTRTFEVGAAEAKSAIGDIVQRIATKLGQPYGVIYAREGTDSRVDPRYRCLVGALEYRRGFNRAAGAGIDSCLEQVTALSPAFADGFAMRALLALRRYYEWEIDGAAALEQAMGLAQRAVDLKPQGARPRQALMSALFARGDVAGALAEGKLAVTLNPYDMVVLHAYGMRLVLSGRTAEGAALVRRAATLSPVRPASFEFGLFLCAYLLGDSDGEAEPRLFTNNDYPLVLVARAIAAARAGNSAEAQQAVDRLLVLHPGWGSNPRSRLQRYLVSASLAERLMQDLTTAGLRETR